MEVEMLIPLSRRWRVQRAIKKLGWRVSRPELERIQMMFELYPHRVDRLYQLLSIQRKMGVVETDFDLRMHEICALLDEGLHLSVLTRSGHEMGQIGWMIGEVEDMLPLLAASAQEKNRLDGYHWKMAVPQLEEWAERVCDCIAALKDLRQYQVERG